MTCPACRTPAEAGARFCGACGAPVAVEVAEWTVGSGEDATIRLEHPSVSRAHLAVTRTADPRVLHLRDLGSSNGTWHRATRVREADVGVDDTVQLGLLPVPVSRLLPSRGTAVTGRVKVIGRDPGVDLRFDLPSVSGRHAEARLGPGGLEVRDLGSRNGTYVDGRRVSDWTVVPPGGRLSLGSYHLSAFELASLQRDDPLAPVGVPLTGRITIGRDPKSTIPIDHAAISWHHARVDVAKDGRATITDLGSTNGTYVNGARVRTAVVKPGDQVRLGAVPLDLRDGKLVPDKKKAGEIRLDVQGVSRRLTSGPASGKVILDDVSVTIFPGEMVALMGPAGAGKTTLLEVLTGQRPPSSGSVLVNGVDLHQRRATLAERIGYVPQEDVMHRDLTVFEVVYHAARLRLPGDLPDRAVRAHVDKLLVRMGLAHIRQTPIGGEQVRGISGGQRKRVNIAIELITEPPLLFLDEPTSGLDATSTLEVLTVLRGLADEGMTIIMTIHQPRVEAFLMVDMLLLLAKGGKLAYFGPTNSAASYFSDHSDKKFAGDTNPADYSLDALEPPGVKEPPSPDQWQQRFRSSPHYQSYVTSRQEKIDVPPVNPRNRRARGVLSQAITLLRRNLVRKTRDGTAIALQVLQPTIIGVLLVAVFWGLDWPPGEIAQAAAEGAAKCDPRLLDAVAGAAPMPTNADLLAANKAHAVLFLVAATAFWLGCSNVARELVAERAVYRRERMSGLSPFAYMTSAFVVQAGIGFAQVFVLVALVWGGVNLESSMPLAYGFASLTLASGIGIGLLVSATVRTEVTAISTLPLLLLPQLMLAGYLQLYREMGWLLQTLSALLPVRWAFEGLVNLEYASTDSLIYDVECSIGFAGGGWVAPTVLSAFVAVTLLLTYVRLRLTSLSSGS